MNEQEKWNIVMKNDQSYDGKFYYGVKSTGIYCRPSCASKLPRRDNVIFFDCITDAERSGFRPCKRCHPELLEYDPLSELAQQAKEMIDQNYFERTKLQEGLKQAGVTRRHLTEIFEKQFGTSIEEYMAKVRLARAKELLNEGKKITDVAFAIGMNSSASFATFFKKHTGMTPSDYTATRLIQNPTCYYESPLGLIRIEEDSQGITSLKFADQVTDDIKAVSFGTFLNDTKLQLQDYFSHKRSQFDLPLSISGSDFQKQVWAVLKDIPYGETRSYKQIAKAIGNEKAARAVGMANNRNPILIIIPCHRVVGKDGTLVGYAGGIERKQKLLKLERNQNERKQI